MRIVYIVLMIAVAAVLVVTSLNRPELLAKNAFLNAFIGGDLLNVLAVIVTITLAAAGNLHLKFNELEERHPKALGVFDAARKDIEGGAFSLVWALVVAVVVLIVKAYLGESQIGLSLCNSFGIMILLYNILILIDIGGATFDIKPVIKDEK